MCFVISVCRAVILSSSSSSIIRTNFRNFFPIQPSELFVPTGDVEKFAATLIRILQSDLAAYEKLAEQSVETANHFDWSAIAEDTARSYETHLARWHNELATHGR